MENLDDLLLDLSGFASDEEIYEFGEKIYGKEFLNYNGRSGQIITHDQEPVKFFGDRYFHAFRTSKDRARLPYDKSVVAVDRIQRIYWIKPLIEGRIQNSECWEVPLDMPPNTRPFPGKRLYVLWETCYHIWLEPLRKGGFKFSSAYASSRSDLGRYIENARKIWTCG